jgi:hypothetical protein
VFLIIAAMTDRLLSRGLHGSWGRQSRLSCEEIVDGLNQDLPDVRIRRIIKVEDYCLNQNLPD